MGSSSPLEDSASHNNILEPFDFDFQGILIARTFLDPHLILVT